MEYGFENIYEIGKLQDVLKISLDRKLVWQDYLRNKDLEGFIFVFEKGKIYLWAVADDDTIDLQLNPIIEKHKSYKTLSVKKENPWKGAIGKKIYYLWTMTNQKGYTDGFQIEFGSNEVNAVNATKKITVQLIVIGSRFTVSSLKEFTL